MAVTIPGDKGKPGLPSFQLTGDQVTSENPVSITTLTDEVIPAWEAKDGLTFTKQDVILMQDSVSIEIVDPGGHSVPSYDTSANAFVGGTPFRGRAIGQNFELYYTINGKNPTRTKAYLYTGAFTVAQNTSGSDNCIIKARSYMNGIWSDIAKIELRIV